MDSIAAIQQRLRRAVEEQSFQKEPYNLYEPIDYILGLGGKKLRPALVMLGCQLFAGDTEKAVSPALGIEIFHNFSLVHDDIMDNAPLRRGKPTVHEKWDLPTAILSGDLMLIKALELVMQVDDRLLRQVMEIFNNTAIKVCEGQQLDMNFEKQEKVSLDDYLQMIELKTAVLLGASLQIGALTGGASAKDAQLLYDFGTNIGIAFQLQDDILDVFGTPETFGKQVGGDILSNKKTWLLIKAWELAGAEDKMLMSSWMKGSDHVAGEKISWFRELFEKLGVRKTAEETMEMYFTKAGESLHSIKAIDENNKAMLTQFTEQLLVRVS
jgi:geranylgeranyl diphosphate synthase type II